MTEEERKLTEKRWNVVSSVAWVGDGRGLVLTGNEELGLPRQVWYVSASDGEARRITNDLNSYSGVSLTSDGGLTYINTVGGVSNLWLQPVGGEPRQLTDFASHRIDYFDWSRDGRGLAVVRASETSDVVLLKDNR